MQTITTNYLGATNFKGSRIIAKASGSTARAVVSYDSGLSDEAAHLEGVKALCSKMGWTGELIGGHTQEGMVWVFVAGLSPRIILPNSEYSCKVCGRVGSKHGHYDATDPSTHQFVAGEVK